jgi:GNAT superfamily N-acetyltransferase
MEWEKIKTKKQMAQFWDMSVPYFQEIITDKEDLEYFLGQEYRKVIEKIMRREVEPIEIFFAVHNGENVGFCMFNCENDGTCLLMEFYLNNTLRGKGYGSSLYEKLEISLKERGLKRIRLTAATDNANAFWYAKGYKPTGKIADNDLEYLEKVL